MTKKTSLRITTYLLFGWILSVSAFAVTEADIAVVDLLKAIQVSVEGKKMTDQLKNKENEIIKEITDIEKQTQSLENRYNTQRLTLTQEAQQQILSDIERLRTKRTRIEEDGAKEFRNLQIRLFGKLRAEIMPIVSDVAEEKGFFLVLDLTSGGVLYFNQTIDITEEVIKRYDQIKSR